MRHTGLPGWHQIFGYFCSPRGDRIDAFVSQEGLWDSVMAGNVVQWVLDVEVVYADRTLGCTLDWVRMNSVQMNINT
jgi:hypothetical protein